jgi:short-subunit dehydrogenase
MADYPFTRALITGASSGIGESMVELLGEAGVPMVVVARREDRLQELAARYADVEVLAADLTTAKGLRAVEQRIVSTKLPTVDLVVNNAGFGNSGWFHEIDAARLDAEVQLNIAALTRLSRVALGVMVPRRRGFLLNVSSVASFQPAPKLAVYAATKAYVTSLTESIHEEAKPHSVHVTALCPGLTHTEFQSVSNTEEYATDFPAWMWLQARDVAEAGLQDVAKGRALSVPGALYKGLSATANVTPRMIKRRLSGLIQR